MPNPATGYSPLDMFGPLAELFQGTLPQSPTQGDNPEAFLSAPGQAPVTAPTTPPQAAAPPIPPGTNPTDALRTMIMTKLMERLQEPPPDVGMGAFWKHGLTGIREQGNQYATRQQGANTMLGVLNNIDRGEVNDERNYWRDQANQRGLAGIDLARQRLELSKKKFELQQQGFDSFEKEEYNQQTGRNEVFLYSMRRDPESGKMEVIGKEPTGIAAYGLMPPMEVPGKGMIQLPNKPTGSAPAPNPVQAHPAPTQTGQPASAPPPNAQIVPQQTEAKATSDKPPAPEAQLDLQDKTSSAAVAHKTSTNKAADAPAKRPKTPEEIKATIAKIVAEEYGGGQPQPTSVADPARPGGPAHSTLPIGTRILGIFKQPPGGVASNAAERRAMMSGLKGDILELQRKAHESNQESGLGQFGLPGEVAQNELSQSPNWRRLVPKDARGPLMAFNQSISWLLYQYVKAQTGAQFSYLEFQRYARQFPTATDDPDDAKMLIEGAIANVNRGLQELQRQYGGLVSPLYNPAIDDVMPPEVEKYLESLTDEP